MKIVEYSPYQPTTQENCHICKGALVLKDKTVNVFAHHSKSGQLHPVHELCLQLMRNSGCPSCQPTVDRNLIDDIAKGAKLSLLEIANTVSFGTALHLAIDIFNSQDDEMTFDYFIENGALVLLGIKSYELTEGLIFTLFEDPSITLCSTVGGLIGLFGSFFFTGTNNPESICLMAVSHLAGAMIGGAFGGWFDRLPLTINFRTNS